MYPATNYVSIYLGSPIPLPMLFESEICPLLLGLLLALRPLALDTELFCELVRAGAPHVVSKESAVSSLKAESLSDAIARFCNSCLV